MTAPQFVSTDIDKVTAEFVAIYEDSTGKTLQPAQIEQIMVGLIAYAKNLSNIQINETGRQNLVALCDDLMLDEHGKLTNTPRLGAQGAQTVFEFGLVEPQSIDILYPAGTEVETKDGKVIFATKTDLVFKAGATIGVTEAEATTAGILGNGYLPNEINSAVENLEALEYVKNTTTSTGGSEAEGKESYQQRIMSAPDKYSGAGPTGAYKYWAKTAHQDIVDAAVVTPDEDAEFSYTIGGTTHNASVDQFTGIVTSNGINIGNVNFTAGTMAINLAALGASVGSFTCKIPVGCKVDVYPLTKSGLPSDAIKEIVAITLNQDDKLPTTDLITVKSPEECTFDVVVTLDLLTSADKEATINEVTASLEEYATALRSKLGRSIIPEGFQAIANSVKGVHRGVISGFTYKKLKPYEWANCTSITVNFGTWINE